jgi:hypothetical protein
VPDAELDPAGEGVLAGDVGGGDAQPAVHLPALHDGDGGRRGGDQAVRLGWVDADEHAALPAGADRQVPPDEEREAAEHLLLGELGVRADQITDPPGEDFVIAHAADRTSRRAGAVSS